VMVHVVIHLVCECKLGGPVHYHWMYPIERYDTIHSIKVILYSIVLDYTLLCNIYMCLHRFKINVRNKAASEGSIVEGYIMDEQLTYCSRYLENVTTVHNRPPRQLDYSRGAVRTVKLDDTTLNQAHRYILLNIDMFAPYRT